MPLRPTAMNTAENVKHIVAVVAVNSDPSQNSQLNKDERCVDLKCFLLFFNTSSLLIG